MIRLVFIAVKLSSVSASSTVLVKSAARWVVRVVNRIFAFVENQKVIPSLSSARKGLFCSESILDYY